MWEFIKDKVAYIWTTFHNNETIIWSRLQMAGGSAWVALVNNKDQLPNIISNVKYLGYAIIAIGLVTELLRRRGAEFTGADDKDTK